MSKSLDKVLVPESIPEPSKKTKKPKYASSSKLSDDILIFKKDDIVTELRRFLRGNDYYNVTDDRFEELKNALIWVKRAKNFRIHGPEDLTIAQNALNEIQAYRDRAVEINLDAITRQSKITRAANACYNQLLMYDAFLSRTEAVKNRIVQIVLGSGFGDAQSSVDTLVESAKLVVKNCRDAYDTVRTQTDVAKQQWFTAGNRLTEKMTLTLEE